jgi:hypothetical protein
VCPTQTLTTSHGLDRLGYVVQVRRSDHPSGNPDHRRTHGEQRGKDIEEHWHSGIPISRELSIISRRTYSFRAGKSHGFYSKKNTGRFHSWFARNPITARPLHPLALGKRLTNGRFWIITETQSLAQEAKMLARNHKTRCVNML